MALARRIASQGLVGVLLLVVVVPVWAKILHVPSVDYPSIQAAVDAAGTDDVIIVAPGIYNENVDVNKRLTIRSSAGAAGTIVLAADANDHVFEVSADSVTIEGFSARGANYHVSGAWYPRAGICLNNVNYCNVFRNHTSDNNIGVMLEDSFHNTLRDNESSNIHAGIYLGSSSNNTLSGNDVRSNTEGYGIKLWYSSNNRLEANIVASNADYGIWLYYSSNNSLIDNEVKENLSPTAGIVVQNCTGNTYSGNHVMNNEGDGLLFREADHETVRNNNIENNKDRGIEAWHVDNSAFTGNIVRGNGYTGLHFIYGGRNVVTRNNLIGNGDAMYLP